MYDVVIIGGGASGFFTAINIAKEKGNAKILIVEKSTQVLNKVRISGGGRCNVTHAEFDNKELIKNYPRGAKSLQNVFSKFNTSDTIDWFYKENITLHTEADGRMFPTSNNAETIINCFKNLCNKYAIEIITSNTFQQFEKTEHVVYHWNCIVKDNHTNILTNYYTKNIVISCGGFPKKENYNWLKTLGYKIAEPIPSLFTFNLQDNKLKELMGLSVAHATVKINNTNSFYSGALLVTHWGISGPAVLKLSAYNAINLFNLNYCYNVSIHWNNLLEDDDLRKIFLEYKQVHNKKNVSLNPPLQVEEYIIPKRLWHFICEESAIPKDLNYASLNKEQINILIKNICNYQTQAIGKTTYKEEFVTAGGIELADINIKTFESLLHSNIYFTGEICNVDGITGGFNFQFAWSSAYIAAKSIATTL